MSIILLERELLEISGEDRRKFLQGLITNDIDKLTPQYALYAALLTPQGKFLYDFFLYDRGDSILLDCAPGWAEGIRQHLTKYKLRAKVTIAAREDVAVTASLEEKLEYADPRSAEMGWRAIASKESISGLSKDMAAYETRRISLGIAEGQKDLTQERSILLEYRFEDIHGVDFEKGCYVGQEVTARSKHRAQLHKMLFRVEADKALPPAGTMILSGEKTVGEMRSSIGSKGLALIRLEAISSEDLQTNAMQIKVALPDR